MSLMTMTETHGMTAAAEVWRVDDGGLGVTLDSGVYGSAESLRLVSDEMTLAAGEGLAGAVLARKVPVLLDELDEESFERCGPANASDVTAAIGLPIFDEGRMSSVLVVMFRGQPGMKGAVELWAGRRGRFELGLTAAHYAGLERFGKVSRYVNFPMGSGLPGEVWQSAAPRILTGLGQSRAFLRSSGAESAGLKTGFGFPVIHRNELSAVMLWLSSEDTPLAKIYEVWETTDGTPETLWRTHCDAKWVPGYTDAVPASPMKPVSEAARLRRPVLFEDPAALGLEVETCVQEAGVFCGVAIPVLVHDRVRAVALLAW